MEMAKLQGETRKTGGSRAAQRLRREGKLPGVIYGHGQETAHLAVDAHAVAGLVSGGSHVIELTIGGTAHSVLIKDVQFDHLGETPIHVDFVRVDLHERVTVSVPLEFRGTPVGIQEGGQLDESMMDIEVETLASQIPDTIRVNVADLKLGDILHVRDLELPSGIKAMTSPDAIVCAVRAKVTAETEAAATTAEGEAAQPEIITAREHKEEGAGEK
ncbi:MAG: 50S ribosomal protein L25 [Phycisphaerae bacterium]|nr:50S ribosomal protein L25 [Phycisphaerae bacterium]